MLDAFLNCFPPYSLRLVLSLNLEVIDLARLASQQAGDSLSPCPLCWYYRCALPCLAFAWVLGDLNTGPHACVIISILQNVPFSQDILHVNLYFTLL